MESPSYFGLDSEGPLDTRSLSWARELLSNATYLRTGESLLRIYYHWRVSTYEGDDCAYNILVGMQNGLWVPRVEVDVRLNATDPPQPGYAAHTADRNGNALGISVDAMLDAEPGSFGDYPVQWHLAEMMCAAGAAMGAAYGIDCADPDKVMTHAEVAILDRYFPGDLEQDGFPESGPPYRWDWALFAPDSLSKVVAIGCGNVLRRRTHLYKQALSIPAGGAS